MKLKKIVIFFFINFSILNAKPFTGDPNNIYKNLRLICQGQSILTQTQILLRRLN